MKACAILPSRLAFHQNSMNKKIVVVIPAHNEYEHIGAVVRGVVKKGLRCVVVDDGSETPLDKHISDFECTVLRHCTNLGKGAAMRTGADYAFSTLEADAVIFLDGDGQHSVEEISAFQLQVEQGVPIVLGTRDIWDTMPRMRAFANYALSYLLFLRTRVWIPDILSGYKALNKAGYESVIWQTSQYAVELDIASTIAKKKIPFSIVPIKTIYFDLERGMNILDAIKLFIHFPLW